MRKVIILFVAICLFLVGCGKDENQGNTAISEDVEYGKKDYEKIAEANNALGITWFAEAKPNKAGNIFISPTSLFMALSMVYNGADGTTKEEIEKVLHVEGMESSELNAANASLMNLLHNQSGQIQLNVANSIWLNERYHFQPDFATNNQDYYNAEMEEIDISDPESPKRINNWVKEKTNGKINDLVDSPLDPDLVTMLINAIYFKGDWKYEFDESLTEDRPFYLGDGTTRDTPLMTLNEKIAYMENEDFQAVSLPYGENQEMSMNIFLPKESLEEFTRILTAQNWQKWSGEFKAKEGTLLLPKFKLEYEASLKETLQKLGMTTAFSKGANFGKMIQEPDPLWISQVKQKTYIDVNEKGTEAAAATSVDVVTESFDMNGPFYMEVNRPFFIAITENTSNTILFMGAIANPSYE
ncbi:serpin family protein [Niallia sp. Krafla_26]|uniref:serpin family protein n=1 Tax=Niallia sp. Krafla_26 TaxID=3064703 RepID=UPI003D16ECBD